MSSYRLADHVGVCEVDGRTVMLDLRRDRYFQLDPCSASAFRRLRDGQPSIEFLQPLLERGLVVPGSPGESSALPVTPSSGLPRAPRSARWRAVPEVAGTIALTRLRLHRGLEGAVCHVRRRKPSRGLADAVAPAAVFRAARSLVPLAPNCLTDSLALAAFLSRRGAAWRLVFGVKLDPFAAHCWLQSEDAILNDAPDTVANFTPIIAI